MAFIDAFTSVARTFQALVDTVKPTVTHTIKRGETVALISDQYRGETPRPVFEQRIKDANPQILNWETLYPDETLQIPVDESETVEVFNMAAPADGRTLSPKERVDAAVLKYQQSPTPEARAELKAAIEAEMQDRYAAEYRARPTGAVYDTEGIEHYGISIAARYGNDPQTVSVVKEIVGELKVDHEVTFALDVARGGGDAKAVMNILKSQWESMSPEARARLATSPELASLMRDRVEPWVAEPFANFKDNGDPRAWVTPANDASGRLAQLTAGLPPELAYAVVTQNLDTIMKIAEVKPMYAGEKFGGTSYTNMARVVGSLGDSPEAKQLTSDIASTYLAHAGDWRGQWVPLSENISNSIRDGASPALGLELARQLEAKGRTEEAGVIVRGVLQGAQAVEQRAKADLAEYQSMLTELGRVLKYAEGLPPEALAKAVEEYVNGKDPQWQTKFRELEQRLVDSGNQLKQALVGLNDLPADVKATYPELESQLKDLANKDSVLQAIGLAASRDRSFLVGPEADSMLSLFDVNKVSKEGAELLKRLATDAIQQNALAVFAGLDRTDPASVANAKTQLEQLGKRYANMLGKDASQYQQAISALEKLVDVPGDNALLLQTRLKQFDSALRGIEGFNPDQPAGITFRSIGVAAAGLIFAKSTSELISDPTWANTIAAFGDAAGLHKDIRDLMHRPGSVPVGADTPFTDTQRGIRGEVRFENWNRALGLISATGDVAKMVDALLSDRPYKEVEAGLHAIGGVGTVVMTLSSGPAGALTGAVMVGISVFGNSALAGQRDENAKIEASYQFLIDAGFTPEAARIIGDLGQDKYYQSIPVVPLLMEEGRRGAKTLSPDGRPLTPAETMQAVNNMPPDKLQVYVNNLRL
ncbi:hypothetical protein GCM10011487_43950 [Steroidobacter agaridevorans]|uniref:LysM domain-containing protein n=1 Tax=Steroidobacter agaridevorans TaxID=2695856 RepID=A0A829YG25_9GAMM|nr:LysM domain-containing protein [Steroidobacter agaridevorans]GFE82395.1 hypothetical protein GCM10011487_43950 [Steroidobacter agaridevorans]GFE85216.1 hypothetical protein GCM10011488_01700 [Steroidobacter agaridevorans]